MSRERWRSFSPRAAWRHRLTTVTFSSTLSAQPREQHLDLPARARDLRRHLGALRQRHADAVNRNILDLVIAVADPEPPIYGYCASPRADDFAGHSHAGRIGPASGYDKISVS